MALMKFHPVQVGKDGKMNAKLLRQALEADIQNGLCPCFVVVTLGTTGACFFDDLTSIANLLRNNSEFSTKLPIWIHVDAAYGGTMFFEPELRGSIILKL